MWRVFKWVLRLVGLVVVLALGFTGYMLYEMRGGKQKDLGVRSTRVDTQRVLKQIGLKVSSPDQLYVGAKFATTGSHTIDATFSNTDLSALVNGLQASKGIIKNFQIRVLANNAAEVSFVVDLTKLTSVKVPVIGGFMPDQLPVYVKGVVGVTGPRSLSGDVQTLKAGNLSVPGWILTTAQSRFMNWLNDQLGQMSGLDLKSIDTSNGQAHIVGSVPDAIAPR
jgi:hypothetical protein